MPYFLSYVEFYQDLCVPKESITGVVVEGFLTPQEPCSCWARGRRSGQRQDSRRIFLHDRNFTIYSIPQNLCHCEQQPEVWDLGDQLANRYHGSPPAPGRLKGPGADSGGPLLPPGAGPGFHNSQYIMSCRDNFSSWTILDTPVAQEELKSYKIVNLFTKETAQKGQEKLHFLAINWKPLFLGQLDL